MSKEWKPIIVVLAVVLFVYYGIIKSNALGWLLNLRLSIITGLKSVVELLFIIGATIVAYKVIKGKDKNKK